MYDNIIKGRHYHTGEHISMSMAGGKITAVEKHTDSDNEPARFIAPGLIDNQINGYQGIDFSSRDLTVDAVIDTTKRLWQTGITCYLPTVITSPEDTYRHVMAVLREAIPSPEIRGVIPGIHMEGPYISDKSGYRGAHNPEWIKNPDWSEFERYLKISGGNIRQITLAPELDGAMNFIKKCQDHGIIVAIGHHAASPEVIDRAIANGAAIATHLGNACANLIDRHKNVLWPQLAEDRLMTSLIMDGHHLNRYEAKVFLRAKGPDKIVLISDMTKFAGMPPGEYDWYGHRLTVTADGLIRYNEEDVLAGATMPLISGIMNMHHFTGCSMSSVIDMASRNPARLNRLDDRGSLASGLRADLIVYRRDEDNMNIVQTIVGGETVYTAL